MALQAVPRTSLAADMPDDEGLWRIVSSGDLTGLNPRQRTQYYLYVCRATGLNAATAPFKYVKLPGRNGQPGKEILYADKGAAEQLRKIHHINVRVLDRRIEDGILEVLVEGKDAEGRVDTEIGAVSVANLNGDFLANARMKAMTKAKRRLTLSMCGLGMLDESEVETIPGAQIIDFSPPADGEHDAAPELPAASGTLNRASRPERVNADLIDVDPDTGETLDSGKQEANDASEDGGERRFAALHAEIAAAGNRNGSGFASNIVHQIAHDLGAAIFGVGSLKDLTGQQLYQLRKRIEQLDAAGVGAAWQEAKQALAATLPGTPAPREDQGEPGLDRHTR